MIAASLFCSFPKGSSLLQYFPSYLMISFPLSAKIKVQMVFDVYICLALKYCYVVVMMLRESDSHPALLESSGWVTFIYTVYLKLKNPRPIYI